MAKVVDGLDQFEEDMAMKKASAQQGSNSDEISPEKINELLAALKEQIEDFDTDASETLEALSPVLANGAFGGYLKDLSKAIESYDFESAEESIEELIQAWEDAALIKRLNVVAEQFCDRLQVLTKGGYLGHQITILSIARARLIRAYPLPRIHYGATDSFMLSNVLPKDEMPCSQYHKKLITFPNH